MTLCTCIYSGLIWSTGFSTGAQFKIKTSQNRSFVKHKSKREPINIPSKKVESYLYNGTVTEEDFQRESYPFHVSHLYISIVYIVNYILHIYILYSLYSKHYRIQKAVWHRHLILKLYNPFLLYWSLVRESLMLLIPMRPIYRAERTELESNTLPVQFSLWVISSYPDIHHITASEFAASISRSTHL